MTPNDLYLYKKIVVPKHFQLISAYDEGFKDFVSVWHKIYDDTTINKLYCHEFNILSYSNKIYSYSFELLDFSKNLMKLYIYKNH